MFDMKMLKTSKFFSALLLAGSGAAATAHALPTAPPDSIAPRPAVQGVQYTDSRQTEQLRLLGNRNLPTWTGISVSVNLAGAVLSHATSYGEYEAALRLNFKNKYFPLVELGLGNADCEGETTHLRYKVHSPFGRLGLDYNLKKDKRSKNRVFFGARYGFSAFSYDLTGPDLLTPRWNTTTPFRYTGINGSAHWGEAVFGLEAQIWKFVHMGWSVRYRLRIYEHQHALGHAYYVPGFGKNTSATNFGGTFHLIFDLTQLRKR